MTGGLLTFGCQGWGYPDFQNRLSHSGGRFPKFFKAGDFFSNFFFNVVTAKVHRAKIGEYLIVLFTKVLSWLLGVEVDKLKLNK